MLLWHTERMVECGPKIRSMCCRLCLLSLGEVQCQRERVGQHNRLGPASPAALLSTARNKRH
jgi:hypothetical protein